MKHIALPSDGMTLTQPPSREIMPRDPVTPNHVICLPFLLVWIIVLLQSSSVIPTIGTTSVRRQIFLKIKYKKDYQIYQICIKYVKNYVDFTKMNISEI